MKLRWLGKNVEKKLAPRLLWTARGNKLSNHAQKPENMAERKRGVFFELSRNFLVRKSIFFHFKSACTFHSKFFGINCKQTYESEAPHQNVSCSVSGSQKFSFTSRYHNKYWWLTVKWLTFVLFRWSEWKSALNSAPVTHNITQIILSDDPVSLLTVK